MTCYMPNIIRVEAVPQGGPRGGGRPLAIAVEALRSGLFLTLAYLIWHYVSAPLGKAKLHGAILTAVSFLFTLQEYLFFQARGRLGEVLKSTAVSTGDLSAMLGRCQRMKRYLDVTWLWSLGSKIIGLVSGPLLFAGAASAVTFHLGSRLLSADSILGIFGWFCVITAAFLTLKTFRVYRHVDKVLAQLEVEARELAARRSAIDSLNSAPVTDWKADPSLSGYERLPRSQD